MTFSDYIVIGLIVLAYLVHLYIRYKTYGLPVMIKTLKVEAYRLMLYAERTFGQDEGEFKFSFVYNKLYQFVPRLLQVLISEEQFAKTLQSWYDASKKYLK